MPLQDLTPQLRTRMRRVENLVGLFVTVAAAVLIFGFCYYLYHTAKRKGWFEVKAPCFVFLQNATGLKVGDKVKMLGFDAGEITDIRPMEPFSQTAPVYVEFFIQGDNIGYVWDNSEVHVSSADFLGKRLFEIIPGNVIWVKSEPDPHAVFQQDAKTKAITGIWDKHTDSYTPAKANSKAQLVSTESPALPETLQQIASQVQTNLPKVFGLTNAVNEALARLNVIASNLDLTLADTKPVITNLAQITGQLRNPQGSLGDWMFPTNLKHELEVTLTNLNITLGSAHNTMTNADVRLDEVVFGLGQTLTNIAGITSNLNIQVQSNSNILSQISSVITNADNFVQGLKRHWLLRSAFREKNTNSGPLRPLPSKGGGR